MDHDHSDLLASFLQSSGNGFVSIFRILSLSRHVSVNIWPVWLHHRLQLSYQNFHLVSKYGCGFVIVLTVTIVLGLCP